MCSNICLLKIPLFNFWINLQLPFMTYQITEDRNGVSNKVFKFIGNYPKDIVRRYAFAKMIGE